jgi:hypothetical protein
LTDIMPRILAGQQELPPADRPARHPQPVKLDGEVALEAGPGWLSLDLPPLEVWAEPLKQRKRIESPEFYRLLQQEVTRGIWHSFVVPDSRLESARLPFSRAFAESVCALGCKPAGNCCFGEFCLPSRPQKRTISSRPSARRDG